MLIIQICANRMISANLTRNTESSFWVKKITGGVPQAQRVHVDLIPKSSTTQEKIHVPRTVNQGAHAVNILRFGITCLWNITKL